MTNAEYLDTVADGIIKTTRCQDCIHRPYVVPAKYDILGRCVKYSHIERPDDVCPYVCDDPWYDRVPEEDFFCGFGERKETEE